MSSTRFDILSPSAVNEEAWEELYRDNHSKNVYCHPAYFKAIDAVLPDNFRPDYIITLHCEERLVLLQPIKIRHTWLGNTLELLKPFMGDHVEPLCEDAHREQYLHALIDFVKNEMRPSLIYGRALTSDFTAFLTDHRADLHVKIQHSYRVPFMNLPDSAEVLLEQYKSKFRRELQRRIKVGEKDGIEVRIVENDCLPEHYSMEAAVENLNHLHQLRWKKNEHGKYDFSKELVQKFHNQIHVQSKGEHTMYPSFLELLHKGQVIGSRYALVTPHCYVGYYHSFDPAYRSFGIGNLLLYYSLKYAIEKNIHLFDFKRGEESYKYTWTSDWDHNYDIIIPLGWKGRILFRLKKWREALNLQGRTEGLWRRIQHFSAHAKK